MSMHRTIVQNLSEKLKTHYVFPDIAEKIGACLQQYLEGGAYADMDDELFAMALTMHVQEVNHDEHLWVKWHAEPLPEEHDSLRLNPQWQDERKLEARLDNYGIHKIERLPGNVGLIDIWHFHRPAWGGDTAVAAMNFLANTEALIIDLRQCTGGYPGMIALIASFLFPGEPILLSSIYWRDDDLTQQYWTLPHIAGKPFGGGAVFVLTSRATFSAAEEFASILQTRKRAKIIGVKTDGGAHPGSSYRLSPHFEAFIPIGRLINPVTGTNFEGVGITPDISIPPEQAFTAAYQMALQSILDRHSGAAPGPFQLLVKEVQAALNELEATK